MRVLRRLLATLAALLLAAHGLRSGFLPVVLGGIALAVLAWIPRAWAFQALRAGLGLGVLEWLRVLVTRAQERAGMGEAWLRMAVILGAVALVTALAAWAAPRPPGPDPAQ